MAKQFGARLSNLLMRSEWGIPRLLYRVCVHQDETIYRNGYRQYHLPTHCKHADTYVKLQEFLRTTDLISSNTTYTEDLDGESPADILSKLSPDEEKKWKILKLEHQVIYEKKPFSVPELVTDNMWVELLKLETPSSRMRKYRYYNGVERKKLKEKVRKEQKKEERQEFLKSEIPQESRPAKNTIFLFIYEKTMDILYYERMVKSMQYGPHIVFDMGFEDMMQEVEIKNTLYQIEMCHSANKLAKEPFHISFTNLSPEGSFYHIVNSFKYHTLHNMYTWTDKSYFDLFPKDRLVYLTPDSPNVLESFNPNDVYIIGGLVDKSVQKKVTLAKIKEEGLRMAKFPLDQHLLWSCGSRSLTLDQTLQILLKLKETNDWKESLQFVPRRKIIDVTEQPELLVPRKKYWKEKRLKNDYKVQSSRSTRSNFTNLR